MRDTVFVSYSHKDERYVQEFLTMLYPVASTVNLWSDERIETGGDWLNEIKEALNTTRVAVLCVSDNFLRSKFINQVELPKILADHKKHGTKICWFLIHECLYEETSISSFQAASIKPLATLKTTRKHELKLIAKEIVKLYNKNIEGEMLSNSSISDQGDRSLIEITIKGPFKEWNDITQRLFLESIGVLLNNHSVTIKKVEEGSIKLTVELESVLVDRLFELHAHGFLDNHKVQSIKRIIKPTNEIDEIDIAIVDDHSLFRKSIKTLIEKIAGLNIVGAFSNGKEIVDHLKTNSVDIVLLDLEMPVMNGFDAAKEIIRTNQNVKIIVLSMHSSDEIVSELIELGVHSYLLKDVEPEELIRAIEAVRDNDFYYNKMVSRALKYKTRVGYESTPNLLRTDFTKRELEVLRLICQEMTTKEIGERLFLSDQTVNTHRKNLMKKTNAGGTIGLVKYALANDLIELFTE